MTNIQYYARAQKQDKTFHLRAKEKKKPLQKAFWKGEE